MDFEESDSDGERERDLEVFKNIQIRSTDFTPEMQLACAKFTVEAFNKSKLDKDIASHIKRSMDRDALFEEGGEGGWQVVLGRSFAASFTHETKYLMFYDFAKPRRTIIAFKTQ